jgi:hypothetical protein
MKNMSTFKSFVVAAFVFGTLSIGTFTSCGNKNAEEETEEAVMMEEKAEHPTDGAEHPAADTTATDTTAAQ